jgi:hypothetical protein
VSAGDPAPLRTLAFGDLESAAWGTMLAGETAFLAVGAGASASATAQFTVEGAGEDEPWLIAGDGVELTVAGDGGTVPEGEAGGFVGLCRVSGRVTIGGEEHEIECDGIRGLRAGEPLSAFGSVREITAWFERDEGVMALALRPRKASGHGSDQVSAAVIDAGVSLPVAEPRLSTTYAAGGLPVRMSLELWIGADESEQYPRRVAGEATGAAVGATVDGLELVAARLRCHSRGRDGAGVYLLARRA